MVGLNASYKRVGAQLDIMGVDSEPSIPSDSIEQDSHSILGALHWSVRLSALKAEVCCLVRKSFTKVYQACVFS